MMKSKPTKKIKKEKLPLFLTPEQMSKVSGIGENKLRELIEEEQLEYLAIGNRKLLRIDAVLDYYERCKTPVKTLPMKGRESV